MKNIAVAFVLVSMVSSAQAAKVVSLTGTAKNVKTGAELYAGAELHEGDVLRTGKDSRMSVLLDDDVAIRLDSNTEVTIEKPKAATWLARVSVGNLMGAVRKAINKEPRLQVKTHDAVMGIRGTVIYTHTVADHKKATFLCVCMGTVDLKGKGSEMVKTIRTTHHDFPQLVDGTKVADLAPEYAHTDEDMNEMKNLVSKK